MEKKNNYERQDSNMYKHNSSLKTNYMKGGISMKHILYHEANNKAFTPEVFVQEMRNRDGLMHKEVWNEILGKHVSAQFYHSAMYSVVFREFCGAERLVQSLIANETKESLSEYEANELDTACHMAGCDTECAEIMKYSESNRLYEAKGFLQHIQRRLHQLQQDFYLYMNDSYRCVIDELVTEYQPKIMRGAYAPLIFFYCKKVNTAVFT